jgi:transcriptional regulator with XRE-family HTH domain
MRDEELQLGFLHMPAKSSNHIRSARRRAGLSQEDLAALLGSRVLAVSRYENAWRLPPLQVALACEAVFGVPVAELFPDAFAQTAREVRRRARSRAKRLARARNVQHLFHRKESLQSIAAI